MPTVTVRTMFDLARLVGRPSVQVAVGAGATVRSVLEELAAAHGGLRNRLFDQATGGLHSYLFVELNGRDIRSLQGLETPVGEGDALSVLIPVAGGAGPARHRGRRGAHGSHGRRPKGNWTTVLRDILPAACIFFPGNFIAMSLIHPGALAEVLVRR